MIPEELRNFIEQNCSGKDPSDLIMEVIGKKIEQLGADADEVLAFVEECAKGPTLEQKEADNKRKEKERLVFIEQMEKRLVEVKSGDIALYNKYKAELEADIRKAKSIYASDSQIQEFIVVLEKEMSNVDEKIKKQNQKRNRMIIAILLVFIILCGGGYSLYISNKKKAEAEAFARSPKHLIDVQCDSLCALIEALEEPNDDNYAVQKDKFLKITWTTISDDSQDKGALQYEINKKEKFYNSVRYYARKLVRVFQSNHQISRPHKAYEQEFNDILEYDGLYSLYEFGHQY